MYKDLRFVEGFLIGLFFFIAGATIGITQAKYDAENKIDKTDSLTIYKQTLDSLKIELDNSKNIIYSIRYEKDSVVNEVHFLNDSASIKLFYELVSTN